MEQHHNRQGSCTASRRDRRSRHRRRARGRPRRKCSHRHRSRRVHHSRCPRSRCRGRPHPMGTIRNPQGSCTGSPSRHRFHRRIPQRLNPAASRQGYRSRSPGALHRGRSSERGRHRGRCRGSRLRQTTTWAYSHMHLDRISAVQDIAHSSRVARSTEPSHNTLRVRDSRPLAEDQQTTRCLRSPREANGEKSDPQR